MYGIYESNNLEDLLWPSFWRTTVEIPKPQMPLKPLIWRGSSLGISFKRSDDASKASVSQSLLDSTVYNPKPMKESRKQTEIIFANTYSGPC